MNRVFDLSFVFKNLTKRQIAMGTITFGIWVLLAVLWFFAGWPFYFLLFWLPVHLLAYRLVK